MQQSLTLPSASARGPELAAARVAIDIADRGLAAVLAAELALTPGLALVRPDERADIAVTDRPDGRVGRRILSIAPKGEGPIGPRVSTVPTSNPRLIAAAALLLASGYRIDAEPALEAPAAVAGTALTAREKQVAELLVEGASNKVIARRLDISVHTAKFHVAAVLEKLGARNRSDAVAIALRDGLVAL